jgi:NAD(P)-dependent dehydrogenase (short-subunit alcohol dehydrogenase family)
VVVNNAAVFTAYNILDTSEADWDHLMAINLRGQFLVAKAAIGQMMEQDIVNEARGRLINISSQHGMVGPPDFFAYGVAKGGTVNMTRQLAVDFGPKYIYVNALAPGRILTRHHTEEEALSVDPTISYSLSRTPFHRLGRPLDVTGPAVFLASDDCTYISGHNLVVDGGWMAF